jgi:hypothetical protein
MIMQKQFEVLRDQLDDGQDGIQIAFSGDNTIQAVCLTLEESKRLVARLLEVNKQVSIILSKRWKQ